MGLDSESGNTPEEKASKTKLYPWEGKKWPPPPGAGNYCGEESGIGNEPPDWKVIEGYNDRYPRGRVRSGASPQIRMGCMIWEATCGSGARIGTIQSINTVWCGVRRGTITYAVTCSNLLATATLLIIAATASAFVAL